MRFFVLFLSILSSAWASPRVLEKTKITEQLIPLQTPTNLHPKVTFDEKGNGVAVWEGALSNGKEYAVFASYFSAAMGSWSSPCQLSSSSRVFLHPRVAMKEGEIVVLWQQIADFHTQIYSSHLYVGGEWTPPVLLSDEKTTAIDPQFAFHPAGEGIAVWTQAAEKALEVRAAVLFKGFWEKKSAVRSEEGCLCSLPQVAVQENGQALIVWKCERKTGESIEAATYDLFSSTWGDPFPLVTDQTRIEALQLALNHSGEATVVWTAETEEGKRAVQTANLSLSPLL